MIGAVAYWVTHIEGIEIGILTEPGQEVELNSIDSLYEVDAEIKAFTTEEEAIAWLDSKKTEFAYTGQSYEDTFKEVFGESD